MAGVAVTGSVDASRAEGDQTPDRRSGDRDLLELAHEWCLRASALRNALLTAVDWTLNVHADWMYIPARRHVGPPDHSFTLTRGAPPGQEQTLPSPGTVPDRR
ncbi:hypothetical protein GCM10010524_55450 [Streptomyces mexicanus]